MDDRRIEPSGTLLACESLWKVFGSQSTEAMEAVIANALSKGEVLKQYDCVIGAADVNLQVARGEIFCIMGLSGSGKSTLLRMLNRLIAPTYGRVVIGGQDLATLSSGGLREIRANHIGMVFQKVALLPHRTVLENTAFGLEAHGVKKSRRRQVAQESLARVGLAEWASRYPTELSGGMQQRVGLARAIASDPDIILMDEPFSALDPLIRRQLQREFRALIKDLGKSAVFITHDLSEAVRMGDRIAIMRDGVIVQTGTAEDIVRHPANDYVAEFVADIPRLNLIKAHSIMLPPDGAARVVGTPEHSRMRDLPPVAPTDDLERLINIVIDTRSDALAVVESGTVIGIVTMHSLVSGIVGETDLAKIESETSSEIG